MKDEFLKFAADISAKIVRVNTVESVIHGTVEKQSCLGYVAKLQTLPLFRPGSLYVKCLSETFILRFNHFNVVKE